MDQMKIGKFIAECRKNQNLTQSQLAEKLYITDRAVSKWERGISMPDSSIMLDLCNILKISVNDLLSGEVVTMSEYNQKQEQMLLELVKEKQESDKRLLRIEILIGVITITTLIVLVIIANYVQMENWLQILLIIIGFVPVLIATPVMLKIEQVAGYYECQKCGHKYVPTYKSINLSMHMGRTRYMKCPDCGKRSWNKKVISK